MKIDDAIRANELVTALQDGIEMQREILEGLRESLQEYNDFLAMQIRDMQRNESLISEVEVVSDCCGAKATGGGDELGGIGRCSYCFEGCVFMKEQE